MAGFEQWIKTQRIQCTNYGAVNNRKKIEIENVKTKRATFDHYENTFTMTNNNSSRCQQHHLDYSCCFFSAAADQHWLSTWFLRPVFGCFSIIKSKRKPDKIQFACQFKMLYRGSINFIIFTVSFLLRIDSNTNFTLFYFAALCTQHSIKLTTAIKWKCTFSMVSLCVYEYVARNSFSLKLKGERVE